MPKGLVSSDPLHPEDDMHWYTLGTIPTHRPKQTEGFQCISVRLWKSQWLSAHTKMMTTYTKLMTFCSVYRIKSSKHLVFLVCPACYCLYPVSCVIFLSMIIFKIIPCLLPFHYKSLFHILFYLLPHCCITYLLPTSHILNPHIHPTHCLNIV
jgi:hypothetical protein